MAIKKKKKAAKKKAVKGNGLKKFQSHIKKATAVANRKVKLAEAKLTKAKKEKAAKVKKAVAAYRKKHK